MPEYVLVGGKYVYEMVSIVQDGRGRQYVKVKGVQPPYAMRNAHVPITQCRPIETLEAFGILARQQESNHEHTTGATESMVGVK